MKESLLKPFSIGIVIEDKKRDSDYVKVSPTEVLPLQNGTLNNQNEEMKLNLPDASGVKRLHKASKDNVIVARWYPGDSTNRMTSPDVVAGESVQLYRFADTDEYYWRTMFREPSLRRLETLNIAIGGLAEGGESFDKNSSYFAEMSSHDKHILLQTSIANGEICGYQIKLDMALGKLSILDTNGNNVILDTNNNSININALESINLKTPKFILESPEIILKGNVKIEGTLHASQNISTDASVNAVAEVHGSNI